MRKQRVILEHHADVALVGRHIVDGISVQDDVAVGGCFESRQHHQTGGLSGARRPEHGDEFTLLDVQVEILDHQRFAVVALLYLDESNECVVIRGHRLRTLVLLFSGVPIPCADGTSMCGGPGVSRSRAR
jgi:hypothetical protein